MKISQKKEDKIYEQILSVLYTAFPKPLFTAHIAKEIARDEEFVKRLLLTLKTKKLILEIKKNPKGVNYLRRKRWKLSQEAHNIYKNHQKS